MEENTLTLILVAIVSTLSNFFSALAGGGAGLIQLPALIIIGLPFSKALATHKLASVALGIGAGLRHYKERTLNKKITSIILICGIPGVILGANTILLISTSSATLLLGSLTLCLAIFSNRFKTNHSTLYIESKNNQQLIVGCLCLFAIGFLNGSLASGSGLFVTFLLVKYFNLSYKSAIAYTLILVGFCWNGTGAIILSSNKEIEWQLLYSLLIGSLLGGYIGAHYAILKEEAFIKRCFEFISVLIGLSLLIKGLKF